jgi:hypothetical protein
MNTEKSSTENNPDALTAMDRRQVLAAAAAVRAAVDAFQREMCGHIAEACDRARSWLPPIEDCANGAPMPACVARYRELQDETNSNDVSPARSEAASRALFVEFNSQFQTVSAPAWSLFDMVLGRSECDLQELLNLIHREACSESVDRSMPHAIWKEANAAARRARRNCRARVARAPNRSRVGRQPAAADLVETRP